MDREQRKKEAREMAALAVCCVVAVMAFAWFFVYYFGGQVMNDAILVGLFFAIIICMGYLFERARVKKEDKGDK